MSTLLGLRVFQFLFLSLTVALLLDWILRGRKLP
jgi:hypothetical protein